LFRNVWRCDRPAAARIIVSSSSVGVDSFTSDKSVLAESLTGDGARSVRAPRSTPSGDNASQQTH
jgi:hypothetical protein